MARPSEAERPIGKPVAAIKPTLSERILDGHSRRITVAGAPTQDADALELRLDVRGNAVASGPMSMQFGPTPAGTRRELVVDVTLAEGQRAFLYGHAAITIGGNTRTAVANEVLLYTGEELINAPPTGPAVPAGPPIRDIKLPNGMHVAETRVVGR